MWVIKYRKKSDGSCNFGGEWMSTIYARTEKGARDAFKWVFDENGGDVDIDGYMNMDDVNAYLDEAGLEYDELSMDDKLEFVADVFMEKGRLDIREDWEWIEITNIDTWEKNPRKFDTEDEFGY